MIIFAQQTNPGSAQALRHLQDGRNLQRLVDINLRPPWWQPETAMAMLQGARWIKLNEAELDLLAGESGTLPERMRRLLERCGTEWLVVTRGAAGAVVLTAGGEEHRVVPEGAGTVVDTVGAGDAFTSVVVLGLLRGWDLPCLLARAQSFASAVTGIRGATCKDPAFYRAFVDSWGQP